MSTTTKREQLQASIDTRTLDQMTTELVMLGQREWSNEIGLLTNAYITSMEARFPGTAAAVWAKLDELDELDEAGAFVSFADALLIVRDEAKA